MKVVFHTNIDAYNERRCFPEHFDVVPRKGDFIEVKSEFESYFRDQKLPKRLEVVMITMKEKQIDTYGYETYVYCELWYNKLDLELAFAAGAKPL